MDKGLEELISDFEESLMILNEHKDFFEGVTLFQIDELLFRHKARVKNGDLDEIKELPENLKLSQDNEDVALRDFCDMKSEIKYILNKY